jgi:ribosomal protein S18 acetylase RimI-like enzyme
VEPATLRDEDAAFEFEVEYFRGTANGEESVAEMRTAWAAADSWPRREFRARCEDGRALVVREPSSGSLSLALPVGYLRWDSCGKAQCGCGGGAACIGHIFVSAVWRRQGMAEALLRAAWEGAKAEGLTHSCLSVETWNIGAKALYVKHGYQKAVGQSKESDSETLVLALLQAEAEPESSKAGMHPQAKIDGGSVHVEGEEDAVAAAVEEKTAFDGLGDYVERLGEPMRGGGADADFEQMLLAAMAEEEEQRRAAAAGRDQ